jgi:hypothetical protein
LAFVPSKLMILAGMAKHISYQSIKDALNGDKNRLV